MHFGTEAQSGSKLGHQLQQSDASRRSLTRYMRTRFRALRRLESALIGGRSTLGALARRLGGSFDGASVMMGDKTGVQKRVRNLFPRAIFTQCVAHEGALVRAHMHRDSNLRACIILTPELSA